MIRCHQEQKQMTNPLTSSIE